MITDSAAGSQLPVLGNHDATTTAQPQNSLFDTTARRQFNYQELEALEIFNLGDQRVDSLDQLLNEIRSPGTSIDLQGSSEQSVSQGLELTDYNPAQRFESVGNQAFVENLLFNNEYQPAEINSSSKPQDNNTFTIVGLSLKEDDMDSVQEYELSDKQANAVMEASTALGRVSSIDYASMTLPEDVITEVNQPQQNLGQNNSYELSPYFKGKIIPTDPKIEAQRKAQAQALAEKKLARSLPFTVHLANAAKLFG